MNWPMRKTLNVRLFLFAAAVPALLAGASSCAKPAAPPQARPAAAGLDAFARPDLLAVVDPSAKVGMISSYDRTGGNDDEIRRMQAELQGNPFSAKPEEEEDGRLQEQVLVQRLKVVDRNKRLADDKIAALRSKLAQNAVQRQGQEQQLKLLRDVEGTTATKSQTDADYRLRLLEAQKARTQAASTIDNLKAEEQVTINELRQAKSDWQRYLVERDGQLMEQEVQLRNELEKVVEDFNKAKRMNELVVLRSPQKGIVLKIAERSVGSVIQPAEPFVTLVPFGSEIEVEVDVPAKDIGRIRVDDPVRVKLDAFPFQRHDTLPGKVRVISEDAFAGPKQDAQQEPKKEPTSEQEPPDAIYRTRISLLSATLRDVPAGFRLMPGMKVRAEIKVGTRSVITYFLYPVIRALDESMREP